jgi:hypothetical protein
VKPSRLLALFFVEQKSNAAQSNLVIVSQGAPNDLDAVDKKPVGAVQVFDHKLLVIEKNARMLSGNIFHNKLDVTTRAPADQNIALPELDEAHLFQWAENLKVRPFPDRKGLSKIGSDHLHRGCESAVLLIRFRHSLHSCENLFLAFNTEFSRAFPYQHAIGKSFL